jgi:hypothetical protein
MTRGEACLTFLFLLELTVQGSILLHHLLQRKASLSRLMVATQQVGGENNDMWAFRQGKADCGSDLQKAMVHPMPSGYDSC